MATAAAVGPVHGPLGMGLSPWTYERLVREVLIDQDTTIEWYKDVGLLARSIACHGSGPGAHHHHPVVRSNTYTITRWAGVDKATTVDWCNYLCEACGEYLERVSEPLGGPGTIVEIDEAKFGRWKYHRGRYVDGHWVLGGIERGTDKMFLLPVPQRDSATLIPIVQQYVRRGTTIHTDMWKAYNSLSRCGYQHGMVNHSQHFVYPVTGVHTNSIEGSWTHAKKKLKNHGTSDDLFASYLAWWRKYQKEAPFPHLINQLTVLYPV